MEAELVCLENLFSDETMVPHHTRSCTITVPAKKQQRKPEQNAEKLEPWTCLINEQYTLALDIFGVTPAHQSKCKHTDTCRLYIMPRTT